MRYAKVVVDVPVLTTNRAFDYIVPEQLEEWIEIGSRVGVPFGGQTIQGFVVELQEASMVGSDKLKAIKEVLDLYPSLSPELVQLAGWMSKTYVCHEYTALQSMVPSALKAKYERYIRVDLDMAQQSILSPEAQQVVLAVTKAQPILVDELFKQFPDASGILKEMLRQGLLLETRAAKGRVAIKKLLTVSPACSKEELSAWINQLPAQSRKQKEVLLHFQNHSEPVLLTELVKQLNISSAAVKTLEKKGILKVEEVEVFRDPYAERTFPRTTALPLTPDQAEVLEEILQALRQVQKETFLLHGVTGSGKTEVYLQAIEFCLSQGREAIVLVPEISLTPQMVERFKSRFGDEVAVLHSRLSAGERYDEWRKIMMKNARVVIGARSAVFAPLTRIGLIIIDEEHESSYKQEESPKYHARDVAEMRAQYHQAAVILGSATPSLESYYAAHK
ncbi:MAG: primosomal protein N', partial [Paenibacillus sp. RIFOXYA1_FULL_44_5]